MTGPTVLLCRRDRAVTPHGHAPPGPLHPGEDAVLRQVLLSASRSRKVRDVVETAPLSRTVVHRFVAGEHADDAVAAARSLTDDGLYVTVDHLGEDTREPAQAQAVRDAYLTLLRRLDEAGLAGRAEVSVKLSAVGRYLPRDGERIALAHAHAVCEAAKGCGTTVTLDMEDHTTTDDTLSVLRDLRADFPWVGAVLQAYLRRTEADCVDLAGEGSRVRLCKGAYAEPPSVAFTDRREVDRSYVRCLKVLMGGRGLPMVATHDPVLIDIAAALAATSHRQPGGYEFQMLYGIRPAEQLRLAACGERVRVYLPYGDQWYGYLMRRLAERPANMMFFLRSLATKR